MQKTMLRTGRGLLALAALVLVGGTVAAWAQKAKTTVGPPVEKGTKASQKERVVRSCESDVLKGLQGVRILINVEGSGNDAKTIGLTEEQIESATELSLRRNGVPVLTIAEWIKKPGNPILYVNVGYHAGGAYSISVELSEDVSLVRDSNTVVIAATTWKKSALGTGRDASFIVKWVESYVDKFCLDYLKANPK